jgi:hypothetical protein
LTETYSRRDTGESIAGEGQAREGGSCDIPLPCSCSRPVESKIGLGDTEFNAATAGTSYIAVNGGPFIVALDFSINFRQRPPPGSSYACLRNFIQNLGSRD